MNHFSLYNRIGWLILIMLSAYFTFSVCISQLVRFINGPIVVTLEKDYRNWAYEPMAITICTDYLHENAADELIERFSRNLKEFDTNSSNSYRHLFNVIGSLNAENIDRMNEIGNIDLFGTLTGDDLMAIATEV